MQNLKLILLGIVALSMTNCVQKSYKHTVEFQLDTKKLKNVYKVGIRGNNSLHWDYDTEMKLDIKDSLYKITINYDTGYKFVEVKFVVNDAFELKEQDNRRVYFEPKGITVYRAEFNTLKK